MMSIAAPRAGNRSMIDPLAGTGTCLSNVKNCIGALIQYAHYTLPPLLRSQALIMAVRNPKPDILSHMTAKGRAPK